MQKYSIHMIVYDILYVLLLSCTSVLLTVDLCEDTNTAGFVRDPGAVQFVSTRIMQCKYNENGLLHVVPWLFALTGPSTALMFALTIVRLSTSSSDHTTYIISTGLLCMTLGPILVVRFDEINLLGDFGTLQFTGFSTDPLIWHSMGVALLVLGIFLFNVVILGHILHMRRRPAQLQVLALEYEFFETVYIIVLVVFVVTFAARQHFVAASLEYVLLALVVIFVFMSRQLYYMLPGMPVVIQQQTTKALGFYSHI